MPVPALVSDADVPAITSVILPTPLLVIEIAPLVPTVIFPAVRAPEVIVKFESALLVPTAPEKVTVPAPALMTTGEFAKLVSLT